MNQPNEEYDGAGVAGFCIALLILYWVLRAILGSSDSSK